MYQRLRIKDMISRIKEILQIIILGMDELNDSEQEKVMNSITKIRGEIMHIEWALDRLS